MCVCVFVYVCDVYIYIYICVCVCCVYIRVCVCLYMCVMCVYMCVCMCVCDVYIYIYMCVCVCDVCVRNTRCFSPAKRLLEQASILRYMYTACPDSVSGEPDYHLQKISSLVGSDIVSFLLLFTHVSKHSVFFNCKVNQS